MINHLNIAVADDEASMRDYFRDLLPRLGHQVLVAENGKQLIELCRAFPPDLIITDIKMPDMEGIQAVEEITRDQEIPTILVSAHYDVALRERAMQQHVLAYLVKPVKQPDIETAIDLALKRFEHYKALRKDSADLRQALEDRKVIERAKGAVMVRLGVDEDEAFHRMRRQASETNRKLVEIARQVIAAEEVFRQLI